MLLLLEGRLKRLQGYYVDPRGIEQLIAMRATTG